MVGRDITWTKFKDLFTARFGGKETATSALMKMSHEKPLKDVTMGAFGIRLRSFLKARWENLTMAEVINATVLFQLATQDQRFERVALTSDIKTEDQFLSEMRAFSYAKKSPVIVTDNFSTGPEAKRHKPPDYRIKCHYCGNLGHKVMECQKRIKFGKQRNTRNPNESQSAATSKVICFKCREEGHIAPSCPMLRKGKNNGSTPKGGSNSKNEKRVDFCVTEASIGKLIHLGESYPFYFDSAAECSLIKESVALKFSGKRKTNTVMMRGIGDTCVKCISQILSLVCINGFTLEIIFHVLADSHLKYDIMIGREILSRCFDVNITQNGIVINRGKIISVCSKVKENEININEVDTDIIGNDKNRLISVLEKFKDSFITGFPRARVNTGQLEIRLIDPNVTVQRSPYRLSEEERRLVRERISKLIEAKIVRPSNSPFASPILLVKKKDGSERLCVDYRELNKNTVADRFLLPLIADQIARLQKAKYFISLDMASGFHQIPIHPNSTEYTAFVTPDGQYEYITMPFGLKNAPSVFQRAIFKALGDLAYSYVVVYLDDVLITADSVDQALERLDIVLNTLVNAGFSFNFSKCSFLKTSVLYLGYVIHNGEVRPNPGKIQALSSLSAPTTVTQLRQFIGLASYFRKFVPKFSQIMKPLYALTSSNKNISWTDRHEKIRQRIISILTDEPVLMIFDPKYPIELHTDASLDGYGAILMQKVEGKNRVVEYYSKRTSPAESRYHSYELETLAVVNAIKHFRHYLHGREFLVVTDCNSLKASSNKVNLNDRVHRWWAYLQTFNFNIMYREGKRMAHVDFFSRNPIDIDRVEINKIKEKEINLTEISKGWLLAEQRRDPQISEIVTKLQNDELAEDIASTYELRSSTLYRKIQRKGRTLSLPIVPRGFRWSVINHVHQSIMHLGWDKTLEKLYEYHWFRGMAKYVRKFVENCHACQVSKTSSGKVQAELYPIPKISIPWHTVHMDITGKLSGKSDLKEYVIVLIDAFTKFVFLHHTRKLDSFNTVKALKSAIFLFGSPCRVIADQGRCFTGKEFKDFCSEKQIKLHLIATGASRANGQVERVMGTLKNMFTTVETTGRTWQDAIGEIQLALNCTTNRVTKSSPLELLIGKAARPFGLLLPDNMEEREIVISDVRQQAIKNIEINAKYDKERYDKTKAKVVRFNLGDFVLRKNEERNQTKLDPKFRGPFVIAEILEGNRYVLKTLDGKRSYKYSHDKLRKMPDSCIPAELDICSDGDGSDNDSLSTPIQEEH